MARVARPREDGSAPRRFPHRSTPRWLLAIALALAACLTDGPVVRSAAAQGTPIDLAMAIHERGYFRDTGGGNWTEHGADGKVIYRFRETRRSQSAVFLRDDSRNVALELNRAERAIYYTDATSTRAKLIDITLTREAARAAYFQVRLRSDQMCLRATYNEADRSFRPELLSDCDGSPEQQWNIETGRVMQVKNEQVQTYRWRNLRSQMRGADLCLQGAARCTLPAGSCEPTSSLTLGTCDLREEQRWVHAPPPAQGGGSLGALSTIADGSKCLKHSRVDVTRTRNGPVFWDLSMDSCGGTLNTDPHWIVQRR